jgi:cold shock CspA family protein
MSKSQNTFNKKELEDKKKKKKQEKQQKMEERKANADKRKNMDDMIAYVDEYGNITSVPPDPNKRSKVNAEDIQVGISRKGATDAVEEGRRGTVTFFNTSKGYGFIKDSKTQESIFVHVNGLINPIKENDKVTFETEMGQKGPMAVRVKLIN